MEWLKIVAKDHKEWVKLVQSFGEDFFSEEKIHGPCSKWTTH
jgi:hypothetical protein